MKYTHEHINAIKHAHKHINGYNENNSNEATHGNASIKIALRNDPNEITLR